jgi:hypothetical protein
MKSGGTESRGALYCGALICAFVLAKPAVLHAAVEVEPADRAAINSRLDALFGSHLPYDKFLQTLKECTAAHDWRALAALVAYPIRIKIAGERRRISSPEQFLQHANTLLSARVIAAIREQQYVTLFANDRGVMIGDGEIWFSGICGDTRCVDRTIKITAINP